MSSWLNWYLCLLLLLIWIESCFDIYVICVIDCTVIKGAIIYTTCMVQKRYFIFLACVCYCVQLKRLFIIVVHISSGIIFYERHLEIRLFYYYQAFLVCNSTAVMICNFGPTTKVDTMLIDIILVIINRWSLNWWRLVFLFIKLVFYLAFAKWPIPSERKQFQQAFTESKIFESYSSKPEQLYIEHFQFWKQATKHKSSII